MTRPFLLFCLVFGGFSYLLSRFDDWKNHPALREPDGQSHRGDKMVASDIDDLRVLAELSRRFKSTRPMRLVQQGENWDVSGANDFERRQEYLLRLLDYYWFSKQRLLGIAKAQVEDIFGPLQWSHPEQAFINAGRDTFLIWFEAGRVSGGFYATGY